MTSPAVDPVSLQPELKSCAVRVEPVLATASPPRPRRRLVVVGGGMAGLATLEALAEHGDAGYEITLVGAEAALPYDRVRLSRALGTEGDPGLELRGADWFAEHGIAVRTGVAAEALDLRGGEVRLSDGDVLGWDRLVLATGSAPALPPIPGIERDGVHAFRTLLDVRAILASATAGRRAVVVGGGLLGLEAARGLQARGLGVTVVHLADRLMEQQLDALGARVLERRLRDMGIAMRLGAVTEEITGGGRVTGLRLADGEELPADVVVVATGVRPDVALARDAGLEVGRGIAVDDQMRAGHAGVLAVGECAEHRGVVYGLWPPARRQRGSPRRRWPPAGRLPRRHALDDAEGHGRRPLLRRPAGGAGGRARGRGPGLPLGPLSQARPRRRPRGRGGADRRAGGGPGPARPDRARRARARGGARRRARRPRPPRATRSCAPATRSRGRRSSARSPRAGSSASSRSRR